MSGRNVETGSTDQSIVVWAFDSDGAAVEVTPASGGLSAAYRVDTDGREGTPVAMTLVARTTPGVHRDSAITYKGAGKHEIDLPDAAIAAGEVSVELAATGVASVYVEKLDVSAGGGSDPLENPVPGSYEEGTAGHALGTIPATVAAVVRAANAEADSPDVAPGERLSIVRGDDYYNADGFPITVTLSSVANDLAVASATLWLYRGGTRVSAATADIVIAANTLVATFDVGRDKTSQLPKGDGQWSMEINITGGHYREPVQGPLLVIERVGPVT